MNFFIAYRTLFEDPLGHSVFKGFGNTILENSECISSIEDIREIESAIKSKLKAPKGFKIQVCVTNVEKLPIGE